MREAEKGRTLELANSRSRGVRWKMHSNSQPCLEPEVRQGWKGGKDPGV
jgi:hypothetical protein